MNLKNSYVDKVSYLRKYPILITMGFFIITTMTAFVHHEYWTIFDQDGLIYLQLGRTIITGNGENAALFNAGPGGPVLFASLEKVFGDGFSVIKVISILSGTGIVFFSFYIIRNIFDYKTAIVGQLFVAFNPWLGIFSTLAHNELFPVFLSIVSLYFITKKNLMFKDIIIIGILIGIATSFRYQAVVVLISIIVYLLLNSKKIRKGLIYTGTITLFFIIAFSPTIFYNYFTYGTILESDTNFYIAYESKYQNSEWKEEMLRSVGKGSLQAFLIDPDLFLKNYFYNLFYGAPNNLFGFENRVNASLVPAILFFGLIPVFGGLIYVLKIKDVKNNLIITSFTALITAIFVFWLGSIEIHFFAIVIVPLIVLTVLNLQNIKSNLVPLLILPVVFVFVMSILPLRAPQHFLIIWITISTLSAVFFMKLIPEIYCRLKNSQNESRIQFSRDLKIMIVTVIIIILVTNIGYTYITFRTISSDYIFVSVYDEIQEILSSEPTNQRSLEVKEISEILSKQPGIENSYVMGALFTPAYYAKSNWIALHFNEGPENDSIENFITRKNWNEWQIYISNSASRPSDRLGIYNPIPDYLIYLPHEKNLDYLKILSDPTNPKIPDSFELLYINQKSGTVLYKIHNNQK